PIVDREAKVGPAAQRASSSRRRPAWSRSCSLRPHGQGGRPMAKSKPKTPSRISESIEVEVPLSTAYNQWTQFEEFPRFMEGVQSVRQLDEARLVWKAEIGGKTVEWQAKITEQVPDLRIAWRSVTGAKNAGVVRFDRLDDARCRVSLELEY